VFGFVWCGLNGTVDNAVGYLFSSPAAMGEVKRIGCDKVVGPWVWWLIIDVGLVALKT
jgi:hypothetical protein